jgi:hypothetical protein
MSIQARDGSAVDEFSEVAYAAMKAWPALAEDAGVFEPST